jgi:anaerobic selenocysteine-containing dehydrogenase
MNCHPTYCGMVVEIEDDRVLQITGDHENPDSRGFLCVRGHAAAEIVDNPKRILAPRARERRDPDAWRDVTWETALDRIAGRIRAEGPSRTAVWAGHGVFTNRLGGPLSARFAHLVGAQWWQPSIVCWGLGGFGFSLTGVTEVNSMEDMAEHAELILLWGANLASQPTTAPRIVAARRRGARVVAIEVRRQRGVRASGRDLPGASRVRRFKPSQPSRIQTTPSGTRSVTRTRRP